MDTDRLHFFDLYEKCRINYFSQFFCDIEQISLESFILIDIYLTIMAMENYWEINIYTI